MIDDMEMNILIKEEDTNPNRMKNPLEDFGHYCQSKRLLPKLREFHNWRRSML